MSIHDRAVEAALAERERAAAEAEATEHRSKVFVAQEAMRVFGSAVDVDDIDHEDGVWTFTDEGFTVRAFDPEYDSDRGHDTYTWSWGDVLVDDLASLGEAILDGTLKVAGVSEATPTVEPDPLVLTPISAA